MKIICVRKLFMTENQILEYKREYNQKAKNTILAFLNTEGGTLYLGIDIDASVYGIKGDIDLEARR
jgi:predicted HTH transcriptional regulator